MTVARIFKFPKPGASTEMKVPSEVPVAKPLGSLLTSFMYSKYSSTVENSGSVSGVSIDDPMVFVVTAADLAADNDVEVVNADERAVVITESTEKNAEINRIIAI